MQFSKLEGPIELEYQRVEGEYAASYGMRVAGSVVSFFLALPWPLILCWPYNGCTVTFPPEGNPEKFTDMLQRKTRQVKEVIVFLLPSLPNSSKSELPTSATPSPHQRPRQTAVMLIVLFIAANFSAQMMDAGRYGLFDDFAGLFSEGFKEELQDPEDTYAREGIWFFPFLWLRPNDVKLMGVAAAPLALLLCIPIFFLNRHLSFLNLVLMSLILIPMGLFYAFLSATSTTWLLFLSPNKVSQLSLILRILGSVFPLIITAFIFALQLSYVESIAQKKATVEETKKKKKKTDVGHHWSEDVFVFLSCVVVICSFVSVSFNLMNSLSTQWNSTLHGNENLGWLSSAETSYLTFALAHLALSISVMVMALLVLLVGKKFTGLTSFFLGIANITTSVFITVYFYQACAGCLREEVEKSFGTLNIFDLSLVLGLFIGIFGTLSGLKAFFKLVISLLKMLLVLPLLVGLALITFTKSIISFVRLLQRKVY